MKFSVLLSIVCIGIGVAIGWLIKPDSAESGSEAAQANPPEPSNREQNSSSRDLVSESDRSPKISSSVRVIGGDAPENMSDEQREEMEKYQSQFEESMKKRRMAKLDARIAKLVANLTLTPEQEAALRKAAEEDMGNISSLFSGDIGGARPRDLFGKDALNEVLAEILTDEQKEEHDALKKRELANQVEAKALKELANLSNLDLSQEQKDQAYDLLYKQAEENVGDDSPGAGIVSMVSDGFGIELDIDAADFGIVGGVVESGESSEGNPQDPQEVMKRMRENRQKQIDKKVETLRPILNDNQLDQYRKSLELKNQGLFGGMIEGVE